MHSICILDPGIALSHVAHPLCLPLSSNPSKYTKELQKRKAQVLSFVGNNKINKTKSYPIEAIEMELFDEKECNLNLLQRLNENEKMCKLIIILNKLARKSNK